MADTYLNLVQNFVDELGILGGDAATNITSANFASLTEEEYLNAKRYVANADMWVQRQHIDWNFLWYDYSETLAAAASTFPAISGGSPPTIKHWLKNSFWLDRTGSNPIRLEFVEWKSWRDKHRNGAIQTTQPGFFTVRPDGTIEIDVQADQSYTASAEGYKRPEKMSAHGDESAIPDEFRRIIELRAILDWAGDEDATEILNMKVPEYDILMAQLEGSELPSQDPNLMAENEDLVVEVA